MNFSVKALQKWFGGNASLIRGAAAPMLVVAILAMMVLPMPTWLLDTFFTINIEYYFIIQGIRKRCFAINNKNHQSYQDNNINNNDNGNYFPTHKIAFNWA